MKVALITDTHYGARGDSQAFDDFFREFYTNIFFPELDKRGIKQIIHLGDCFDRRKYINFSSLQSCKDYFFNPARERGIRIDMIVGNHDTFYKNTNNVNSPHLVLGEYDNIVTYKSPFEINVGGLGILMLPWICTDNYKESMEAIERTTADVCFGHFDISGFEMFKGSESTEGLDPSIFKSFKLVCSGHFHHRSTKGNIAYLGNPYQMFWNDYEDPRGFHIFDTNTLELEFVENTYTIFEKVYYNDTKPMVDPEYLKNKLVKVVVVERNDNLAYDHYLDKLYKSNPIEVKIIEDFSEFESDILDDETIDLSDTLTLLSQYVDSLETDINKDKLKMLMKTIFVEAQDYESNGD